MAVPAMIIKGTIAYLVLGLVCLGGIFSTRSSNLLSKDNAAIANVVVSICTFSMWLFWLCAWMHQWHPLIKPIYVGM
jgi:V-type H+-transporting ATPase subunit e